MGAVSAVARVLHNLWMITWMENLTLTRTSRTTCRCETSTKPFAYSVRERVSGQAFGWMKILRTLVPSPHEEPFAHKLQAREGQEVRPRMSLQLIIKHELMRVVFCAWLGWSSCRFMASPG